jgi:PAS domain S-box-containing protein
MDQMRTELGTEPLSAIVGASEDAIVTFQLDRSLIYWNSWAEQLYGYTADEVLGRDVVDLVVPPDRRESLLACFNRVYSGEHVVGVETRCLRKDGQVIDVSISLSPLHEPGAKVVAAACFVRDISAQKAHEHQLRDTEQRFRSLFNNHPDAVFELDCEGRYTNLNPACEKLSGLRPEEVLGKPCGDRTVNPMQVKQAIRAAMAGHPHAFETAMTGGHGRLIPVAVTFVPISVDASAAGVYGITKDIGEWKRVEHTLEIHARQQAAIADLGKLALTEIDPGALQRAATDAIALLLEVEVVRILTAVPDTLLSLVEKTECVQLDDHLVREFLVETGIKLGDGAIGLATRVPGRTEFNGVLLACTRKSRQFSDDDITFVREVANVLGAAIVNTQAADELRRREQELKVLVETTSDNIVRFDDQLRFMYVNPALERMIKLRADSVVGRTIRSVSRDSAELPMWERALRRVFRTGEEDEIEANYGDRCYQVRLSPEIGPEGQVKTVLGVGRDITANKQREADQSKVYQDLLERHIRLHELVEQVLQNQRTSKSGWTERPPMAELTSRERQILRLVARGLTNRQIGHEINLSPGTVKNHISALLPRLSAKDRTHASVIAAQFGLLNDDA